MGWKDLVTGAVEKALEPVEHLETEYDPEKLRQKVCNYFRKAGKGLDTNQPIKSLIDEIADRAFSSLFAGLHSRDWVHKADFIFVLDAACKEILPPRLLQRVSQQEFEAIILAANDRAFEEQRFSPIAWEVVPAFSEEKSVQKKLLWAITEGRKDAATGKHAAQGDVQDFAKRWIGCSVAILRGNGEDVSELLPVERAVELFTKLVDDGALPVGLVADAQDDPPVAPELIDEVVRDAYSGWGDKTGISCVARGEAWRRPKSRAEGYGQHPEGEEQSDEDDSRGNPALAAWGPTKSCEAAAANARAVMQEELGLAPRPAAGYGGASKGAARSGAAGGAWQQTEHSYAHAVPTQRPRMGPYDGLASHGRQGRPQRGAIPFFPSSR
eukprot:TRINITY_DN636_c0_g1_i1.p1 TRINITY_DN636_c0_g1~~TRINITY_DN636_c0_g1_i1.p1  ORF type:complete len:405 (+),score=54.37 TRINITY_DN636_c0_g1_i1:69-1217(+)